MWILFAFLTAVFVSLLDIFTKKAVQKADAYIVTWAWQFFSLPFLCLLLIKEGIPPVQPAFWKTLGFATGILIFAMVYYVKAIQSGDISLSVPMLSLTPVFLLITSPLILGEFPRPFGLLGILCTAAGSYVLFIKDFKCGIWAPFNALWSNKGSRYMLTVAILFSISANFDKIGVFNASPLLWIIALNSTLSVALGIVMIVKVQGITVHIKSAWPLLLAVGVCNAAALLAQMTAITMAMVPYVIAVKRLSIFMSSMYGLIVLKEGGLKERMIGAGLMVAGVFIISFF